MRSLQRRILVASVVGALVSTFLALIGVVFGIRASAEVALADPVAMLAPDSLERCRVQPDHWQRSVGLLRVTAHHPSGLSDNPSVAPLVVGEVPSVGETVHFPRRYGVRYWERRSVTRLAESGPCAVLHARVDVGKEETWALWRIRATALLGLLLGAIVAFAGTMGFAVRPLLARIDALDRSARGIGTPQAHPPVDGTDDALGRVAQTLAASHKRLLANQAELEARHVLLEQHLAGVAHDLRTPIASVQLTLEEMEAEASEGLRSSLGMARMELGALEALADNLLQANRLRGGLEVGADAEVDLVEVCNRVGTRFGILGRARGIRVHVAVPAGRVVAWCDPSLAERAIANLVHNAVAHGPADTPAAVSLDVMEGRFTLVVRSGGDPVSAELLGSMAMRRLTEPTPARSRQGGGLGLGITNVVVARAGWSIHYSSPDDRGLRVEISGDAMPEEEG